MSRKYAFATLRRCGSCNLLYRVPTDTAGEAEAFYNGGYEEGLVTDTPDPADLPALQADRFGHAGEFYAYYLGLLPKFGVASGARLFDYGSSWGYGSWLLAQAGYDVTGYEISRSRAAFAARHLDLEMVEDFGGFLRTAPGSFDVFFSAHVLEHVPDPAFVLRAGLELLKPGGLLFAAFPNGSTQFRSADAEAWQKSWGEAHPQLLEETFLAGALANVPHIVSSRPHLPDEEALGHLKETSGQLVATPLDGSEMWFAARKSA